MKYKVGDKVKIKSLDWYNTNKNKDGDIRHFIDNYGDVYFKEKMSKYCGCIVTITRVNTNSYSIDIDNDKYCWHNFMFDENYKDMKNEIVIPDGWEVEKVEGNKIILKESKKELPKTWEGCLAVLVNEGKLDEETIAGVSPRIYLPKDLVKPFIALSKLSVCRYAYRQGWEPDWTDDSLKAIIECTNGRIVSTTGKSISSILAFQDDEVRKEFLKNFKDLIEEAKELI